MLCKRLVTMLTFVDGVLYRTKKFLPDYRYTHNFIDTWSTDEIVMLDVSRPGTGKKKNFFKTVSRIIKNCFVPVAIGGGIRNINDVAFAINHGADKVVLNTGALLNPFLIEKTAELYGRQSIILAIDIKKHKNGKLEVIGKCGKWQTGRCPISWAKFGQRFGAGEILVTPIDHDGWLQGFDLAICKKISGAVSIPVLINGGAGNWKHMEEGFKIGGAAGVCTQNIYHFTEISINNAKQYLLKNGINVRI